ncbi:MAG: hypothetical protein V7638_1730 [Acidobacteriota bacterium]|jgi:hypothetical protein
MNKVFFALIVFAALATPLSAQTVAFTNVSVIPMDRERVLANQTVVIKNGLIAEDRRREESEAAEGCGACRRHGKVFSSRSRRHAHTPALRQQ